MILRKNIQRRNENESNYLKREKINKHKTDAPVNRRTNTAINSPIILIGHNTRKDESLNYIQIDTKRYIIFLQLVKNPIDTSCVLAVIRM